MFCCCCFCALSYCTNISCYWLDLVIRRSLWREQVTWLWSCPLSFQLVSQGYMHQSKTHDALTIYKLRFISVIHAMTLHIVYYASGGSGGTITHTMNMQQCALPPIHSILQVLFNQMHRNDPPRTLQVTAKVKRDYAVFWKCILSKRVEEIKINDNDEEL